MISVVTPAFNEASNLFALYSRLVQTMAALGMSWEWIVVDDHSRDETFAVLQQLAARDPRVRGLRQAKNSGSHAAITCGLHHAAGDAVVMLAGDLQDPPEVLAEMVTRWRNGAQVVWAMRRQRPGERSHAGFAALYYWLMRNVVGLRGMPSRGADFFLADRLVVDAFRRFPEQPSSVFALLTWIGFRQEYVEYDKQPRAAGVSGWTLGRKIRLVFDSVVAFSDAPIRWCLYGSVALVILAVAVLIAGALLLPTLGGGLLLVLGVVIALSSLQLLAIAIVGGYASRALDEARRRPQYVVESTTAPLDVANAVESVRTD